MKTTKVIRLAALAIILSITQAVAVDCTSYPTNSSHAAATIWHNACAPEFLVGEPGPQGIPGVDGIDGINGQDGIDGIDGNDGIDGLDGQAGADGQADPHHHHLPAS